MKEKGGKKKKGKKGKGKVADDEDEEEAEPEPAAPVEDLESKKPVEVTAEDLADEEWGPANEKSKGKKGKKGKKEEQGMRDCFKKGSSFDLSRNKYSIRSQGGARSGSSDGRRGRTR